MIPASSVAVAPTQVAMGQPQVATGQLTVLPGQPQQLVMMCPNAPVAGDLLGPHVELKQSIEKADFCGCNAKIRFDVSTNTQPWYINEESDCCGRYFLGPGREAKWAVHYGGSKHGPVLFEYSKPCHLQGCCFMRPKLEIFDGFGNKLGRVYDPCRCCKLDNKLYDAANQHIYTTTGSPCQIGLFCPCIANATFDIQPSPALKGVQPGKVTKLWNGCSQLCWGKNRFTIDFPPGTPIEHKGLILGSTMLLNIEYFEINRNS